MQANSLIKKALLTKLKYIKTLSAKRNNPNNRSFWKIPYRNKFIKIITGRAIKYLPILVDFTGSNLLSCIRFNLCKYKAVITKKPSRINFVPRMNPIEEAFS
ncbi:MAG: hypothetical protein ACD_38C00180G0001 [uncultured bacterium]|nr:MAG: hypothetical protein ACD_38C00180G0001 [uncultured bacterium]